MRVFDICSEMRNDSKWCFAFVVHEFSQLRHTIKTSTHRHGCSKKLPGSGQKFMNNQYIQYPLKRSLKPLAWEYFSISISGRKHKPMFWLCTRCTNLVSLRSTVFFFFFYTRTSSSRFPPNFPLNLLWCWCRNTKRFLASIIASANQYKEP